MHGGVMSAMGRTLGRGARVKVLFVSRGMCLHAAWTVKFHGMRFGLSDNILTCFMKLQ